MGLLKKLIKAYKDDKKQSQEFLAKVEAHQAKQAAIASAPKKYSPPFMFLGAPTKIGDMTQAYRYGLILADPIHDVLKSSFEAEVFHFDVEQIDGITYALLNGSRAGVITERCDMINDWIKRGQPFKIFLNSYTEGQDCRIIIVFYKDKSASYKHREQSVVPLSAYKGRARQEISSLLYSKEEVEIGEEYFGNDDDDVVVTYKGEAIGKVPAKIRKRIEEDNYSYAEIEEIVEEENDNGDDIYHPIIRIYW